MSVTIYVDVFCIVGVKLQQAKSTIHGLTTQIENKTKDNNLIVLRITFNITKNLVRGIS